MKSENLESNIKNLSGSRLASFHRCGQVPKLRLYVCRIQFQTYDIFFNLPQMDSGNPPAAPCEHNCNFFVFFEKTKRNKIMITHFGQPFHVF